MATPYFRFKQFTVYHHRCAMKVGTDGVLLGAWAETDIAETILDVGTGSGLIALMLAQKTKALIYTIDIDPDAILQACDNFDNSPWSERIKTEEISLQNFSIKSNNKYDLIISNPPYFVNSLQAPDKQRTTARHDNHLTHNELLFHSKLLLGKTGRICLILPVNEGLQCIDYAQSIHLYCNKLVYVHPKPSVSAKRVLLEFSFQQSERIISKLEIETDERHQYSQEFTMLVKDYYLKL